ncbi:MAG: OsmC family protein [Devosia sp.]
MLEYHLSAARQDGSGSVASTRDATIELDTSLAGRRDALNPVELLLASLAACIIKGVERSAPMLGFTFQSVDVRLRAARQDAPPLLVSIAYELIVATDESKRRLELLHTNVRKYGTISNTLAAAVSLTGTIKHKD